MRLAVISDIHGNALALDAVVADIKQMAPDLTVNLGDHLSGPFEPRRTAEILVDLRLPSVSGNHDRMLLDSQRGEPTSLERLAASEIEDEHWEWLENLPPTKVVADDILLCHATPQDDVTGWLDDFNSEMVSAPTSREFVEKIGAGIPQKLILCGHTHVARMVQLSGGRLVVNPGSVGFPGYRSADGSAKWSAGTPHARYAILDGEGRDWTASFRAVEYDFEAAAKQAEKIGHEAVTSALRCGWV